MCQWTLPVEGLEKARAAADRALEIDPGLPEAHFAIGSRLHRVEWNFEAAERSLLKASAAEHEIPFLHAVYSDLLLGQRRYDEARREIDRALEINPYDMYVVTNSANLDMIQGKEQSAAAVLERGMSLAPGNSHVQAKLGALRCWQGRYREGLDLLETAYEGARDDPFIIGDLGWCYGRADRRGDALELARLLETRALAAEVYVDPGTQAAIYLGLEELDRMYEYLDKAIEISATSMTVRVPIDYRFLELRNEPRFRSVLERVGLPN